MIKGNQTAEGASAHSDRIAPRGASVGGWNASLFGSAMPGLEDPEPTTPFDIVDEGGLLRLRHYRPSAGPAPSRSVLLVSSLFKRPYILDLLPERSVVRSFLSQGFSVYLTDWVPPGPDDAWRGLDVYVNGDLARAVQYVRTREGIDQVSLVGCCLGGLLALVYAALYPQTVQHLVPFASPIRKRPPLAPAAVDAVLRTYGNVPAWWIHAGLNMRVPTPFYLPGYFAQDFGEPELAKLGWNSPSPVLRALQQWLDSDVPFAGRLFREMMCDVYWDGQLADGRLSVGGRNVALKDICCPVLNISAERDRLAPPPTAVSLTEYLGSRDVTNLVFPTGHLGLMVSLAAQKELWPLVGEWLSGGRTVQRYQAR